MITTTNSKAESACPYLWPVGQTGMIAPDRVIAVCLWKSDSIRQNVRHAEKDNLLIDLTDGHPCQWVVFLDSGHIVLTTDPMPVAIIDYQGYPWDNDPRAEESWGS